MRLSIKDIKRYVNGEYDSRIPHKLVRHHHNDIVESFSWDNRDIKRGGLFIAFDGEHVDGHKFVEDACADGAAVILASHDLSESAYNAAITNETIIIRVPDTYKAFMELAREYRANNLTNTKVIGITGSLGKTSTKNMVASIAGKQFDTVFTRGNQNNEIGCPATILTANPDTEILVTEMGMRGLGQIEELCDIARPDWGIVTNVGSCHLELLKTRENIARAKAELYEAIPNGGWAFVNAYNPFSEFMLRESGIIERGASFGVFSGNDEMTHAFVGKMAGMGIDEESIPTSAAKDISVNAQGHASFTLCLARGDKEEEISVELGVPGKHNVYNACAAALVGYVLGIPLENIASALHELEAESGRQSILTADRGFTIIDDTYNASPQSVKAGLDTLRAIQTDGLKIAVLGDMRELGEDEEVEAHRKIGREVAQGGIDGLVCVGELSKHMYDAALEAGMSQSAVAWVERAETATEELKRVMGLGSILLGGEAERDCHDDVVLVKASRFKGLEKVVQNVMVI